MNLNELKRIEKLPHLSDFSAERLITELSLYERVLITTDDVKFVQSTYDNEIPYVSVSKDVKALHEFCLSEKRIMLPCSHCHSDRPFEQSKGWNPRKIIIPKNGNPKYTPSEVSVNSSSLTDEQMERFNIFEPHYRFGTEYLANVDQSNFQDSSWDLYVSECGHRCKIGILGSVSELRKDFICTLDRTHKNFVNFIIIAAVTDEPDEMKSYWKKQYAAQAKDPDATIAKTNDERLAEDLYNIIKESLYFQGFYKEM